MEEAIRDGAYRIVNTGLDKPHLTETPRTPAPQEQLSASELLPPGWTFLKHGTNDGKWPGLDEAESIEVSSGGLSVVSREQAARDAQTGSNTTAAYSGMGEGEPIELRVLFLQEGFAPRRKAPDELAEAKAALDEETKELVGKYYYDNLQRGRHPIIPRGEILRKMGVDRDEKSGHKVYYFIPDSVADLYAAQQTR